MRAGHRVADGLALFFGEAAAFARLGGTFGHDRARRDRVDADAQRRQLERVVLGHGDDGALGRCRKSTSR